MSWSIDRIGMKVAFVGPDDECYCCGMSWPDRGDVFTVVGQGIIEGHAGIFLRELDSVTCSCTSLVCSPWPAEWFRPVNESKTHISALKKIADQRERWRMRDGGAGQRNPR
jgi:hypothetical protein